MGQSAPGWRTGIFGLFCRFCAFPLASPTRFSEAKAEYGLDPRYTGHRMARKQIGLILAERRQPFIRWHEPDESRGSSPEL
jgi:hypothetical protein